MDFEKESKKHALMTFTDNLKENIFNQVVFSFYNQLKKELNERVKEYVQLQEKCGGDNFDYYLGIDDFEIKLSTISEMNIVYSYKEFEINVKRLLGGAYNKKSEGLYNWHELKAFLKSKNIKLSDLEGYNEVNQIRKVNNHIKHSADNKIDDKIKGIEEFKDCKYLRYYELDDFFERVKNSPYVLLESLAEAICKDLFDSEC